MVRDSLIIRAQTTLCRITKENLVHSSNPVGLAVADEQSALVVNKHSMGPVELALERVRLWAVPALPTSKDRAYDAGVEIDPTYHVVLSVGHIEPSVVIGQSLRPREGRPNRGPAVT